MKFRRKLVLVCRVLVEDSCSSVAVEKGINAEILYSCVQKYKE